jgi:5-methylcytosine-specific restriction endonuclease McrA
MLTCSKCGSEKEPSEFYRDRTKPSGYGNWCKDCEKEYSKQPHRKEVDREKSRRYRSENPRRRSIQDKARAAGITREEYLLLESDPCTYCGGAAELVDHIVALSKGGKNGIENLTSACDPCNRSKGSQPLLLFLLGE